jgi:hypothetical protein
MQKPADALIAAVPPYRLMQPPACLAVCVWLGPSRNHATVPPVDQSQQYAEILEVNI